MRKTSIMWYLKIYSLILPDWSGAWRRMKVASSQRSRVRCSIKQLDSLLFCKFYYSPFRKRMQCTFSFFCNKNYTFSEDVFIFEAGCFVKTVSDEVEKEIVIFFRRNVYFFFRKRKILLHSFFGWTISQTRQPVQYTIGHLPMVGGVSGWCLLLLSARWLGTAWFKSDKISRLFGLAARNRLSWFRPLSFSSSSHFLSF